MSEVNALVYSDVWKAELGIEEYSTGTALELHWNCEQHGNSRAHLTSRVRVGHETQLVSRRVQGRPHAMQIHDEYGYQVGNSVYKLGSIGTYTCFGRSEHLRP